MISVRACDLCTRPLAQEVVRLTMRDGHVALLVQRRWRIAANPAGLQVATICHPCHDYLAAALDHMINAFRAPADTEGPRGAEGQDDARVRVSA